MTQRRRSFLRISSMALGAQVFSPQIPQILKNRHPGIYPSDQVNIGLIGCRGRGFHVLTNHLKVPGVNCVALCDIDRNVLDSRLSDLAKAGWPKPEVYEDFRALLDRDDIDAVIIGSPDHWHCLHTIFALEAGKDVYVEKPLANSIRECLLMVAATRKHNRIVQVGQQQRSSEVWQGAIEFVKSGKLGQVRKVNIWGNFDYGLGPKRVPDTPIPSGVNYDLFLGPAPERPFNQARFHGSWRFFWDYGGGLMTDWGVHLIDMAMWVQDLTIPADRVVATGTRLPLLDRSRETFDLTTAVFEYPDFTIQWEHYAGRQTGPYDRHYGVAFVGENGTLIADRRSWFVTPEYESPSNTAKMDAVSPTQGSHGHELHPANFVDCLKTRKDPNCTIEMGAAVAINAHLANIALRTESYHLRWDQQAKKIKGNRRADRLVTPEYRKPWKIPKVD